jgi:hypothetical protein
MEADAKTLNDDLEAIRRVVEPFFVGYVGIKTSNSS